MPRLQTACLLAAILLAASCGDDRPPPPSMADPADAAEISSTLESDVRAMADLSPADKAKAEMAFGPRLRRDLEACRGTRYENKPLYLLAQWTLVHGRPEEVLPLVDRLEILPAPAYRNAGKAVRVAALLRLGRLAEARPIAMQLEELVPEFGALRRVEFHETVGQPAPLLPGTVVSGAGDTPDGSFILLTFIGMPDAAAESWLLPLKEAGGERVHTIAVATAGDLLAASTVASAWGVEVRWTRASDETLAPWRLPVLPMAVLLGPGPKRLVVAVDPQPEQLQRLAPRPR
jgi:hypothetical protein